MFKCFIIPMIIFYKIWCIVLFRSFHGFINRYYISKITINGVSVSNAQLKILNHNELIFEDKELTKAGLNIVKILDKINNINKSK